MTIRNLTLALLVLALCTAAHADGLPDRLPSDPARPGWRPPATRPYQPAAGVDYDFDPGRGPLLDAHAEDRLWIVTPGTWGASTGPVQVSTGPVVARPVPCVPGPAGLLGAGAMFHASRQLRRRIIR